MPLLALSVPNRLLGYYRAANCSIAQNHMPDRSHMSYNDIVICIYIIFCLLSSSCSCMYQPSCMLLPVLILNLFILYLQYVGQAYVPTKHLLQTYLRDADRSVIDSSIGRVVK